MAWYEGTFACGHEGRVNIIGPQKDRGYKKERAFSRLCPKHIFLLFGWRKHRKSSFCCIHLRTLN